MAFNQPETLEDIILSNDRRGMAGLRAFLAKDFCSLAAKLAYAKFSRTLIVTGFYLSTLDAPETDGPPGALALGSAISRLGGHVMYVTDFPTYHLLDQFKEVGQQEYCFPVLDEGESKTETHRLIDQYQPTLLISVERCGPTRNGQFLNSRGLDISAHTARLDEMFHAEIPSIGIGDGGNEIGMGNLAEVIPEIPGLPSQPAITRVTALVIASVSNWGAYGLTAGLSALSGLDLLPEENQETQLLRDLYDLGCFDGVNPVPACGVDGFSLEENNQVLRRLRIWLAQQGK